MKQCPNCKKIIDDDEIMCPSCGANLKQSQPDNSTLDNNNFINQTDYSRNNNTNNLDLISSLSKANYVINNAYEYFNKCNESYKKIEIEKAAGEALTAKGQLTNTAKGVIGFFTNNPKLLYEGFGHLFTKNKTYRGEIKYRFKEILTSLKKVSPLLVFVLFAGFLPEGGFLGILKNICAAIGVIGVIAFYVLSFKTFKRSYHVKNNYRENTKEYEDSFYENAITACKILKDNKQNLAFIPTQYWYPTATEYMFNMAQQSRVSNINEALKMCDEFISREETDLNKKERIDESKAFRTMFIDDDSPCNYQYLSDEQYYRGQLSRLLDTLLGEGKN